MPTSIPTPILRVIHTQNAILPRQIITQTITYADYTTTAIVTLGPGDPTAAPRPPVPPGSPQGSDSLTGRDIGIIIGSILGAAVLALLIWLSCVIRRRMIEAEFDEYEDEDESVATYEVQYPQPTYWPRFPMSIPPPAVPTYRARARPRTYTANGAARRASTRYMYYGDQGRT
ncbi:hypothetical protein HD806DRAFT_389785 [Xylariaceae sp. AK1471]|nr:hypothetical protein HD806DRAFT_389785 [Xylariaceae sp. AK1471]